MTVHRNPGREEIERILKSATIIAVVGLSDKPERDSFRVAAYLNGQKYTIIPVNPNVQEVLGKPSYKRLADIPQAVDIAVIFRKSEDVGPIVDEAILSGVKTIWMQEGVVNEPAAQKAQEAGLAVVMNRCIMKDHRQPL